MTAELILTAGLVLAPQVQDAAAKLVRVYIHTVDGGEASELRDRRESVKDLARWLGDKKKDLVLVDQEDRADVVLEVELRWVTTPRVVVSATGSRPGQPSMPAAMPASQIAHVRVELTHRDERVELTNKNSPVESNRGWQSAAEDVAKQAHKWIVEHRAAILAAR